MTPIDDPRQRERAATVQRIMAERDADEVKDAEALKEAIGRVLKAAFLFGMVLLACVIAAGFLTGRVSI